MSMVQFIVDDVFKQTEGIVIDDKPDWIQGFRSKDDFRDVIVSMQSATGMPIRESVKDMAGTELKLFRYCVHEKRRHAFNWRGSDRSFLFECMNGQKISRSFLLWKHFQTRRRGEYAAPCNACDCICKCL